MTIRSGTVGTEKLTKFVIKVLQKMGVTEGDTPITANMLVVTDLRARR